VTSKLLHFVQPREISLGIGSIPFVDVAVITVQYQDPDCISEPAFGFLVPSTEPNIPILGVIYDTCSFPQDGKTSIFTVMMGGSWFEPLFGAEPSLEHLENLAVQQLEQICGIKSKPKRVIGRIHRQCIAQYTVGHAQRVAQVRALIGQHKLPISLVGSSYDGVGVNDAIMSSKVQIIK
jgi:oxygen-dependent protoporphyrinogen oxidase